MPTIKSIESNSLDGLFVRTGEGELCGPYDSLAEAVLDVEYWDDIEANVRDLVKHTARTSKAPSGSRLVVDGSMYSPSDRALPGVEEVYQRSEEDGIRDIWDVYEERMEKLLDDLGLYWEDGCLWLANERTDCTFQTQHPDDPTPCPDCDRTVTIPAIKVQELSELVAQAKDAADRANDDDEHDALLALIEALDDGVITLNNNLEV